MTTITRKCETLGCEINMTGESESLPRFCPEHATRAADPGAPPEHIMQFFAYQHLPPHLQDISRPFGELAATLCGVLPRNPERTVALRKLLEGKDAAVRALLAKDGR